VNESCPACLVEQQPHKRPTIYRVTDSSTTFLAYGASLWRFATFQGLFGATRHSLFGFGVCAKDIK